VGSEGVGGEAVGAFEFGEGAACRVETRPYRVVAEIATGLEPEGVPAGTATSSRGQACLANAGRGRLRLARHERRISGIV
jgi:hypothetical protein